MQQIMGQNSHHAPEAGYVLGVDIGGTNLRAAMANMSGTVVARWSASTVGLRGHEAVVDLIGDGVEGLLQATGRSRESLRAFAAGVPGVTDVENGVVIATSYLMGWKNIPFRALLEKKLGLPIAIDNDVNMAALGEYCVGAAKDVHDFVFVAIGTGIGAGILLNGRPFRGQLWGAGEIGYMILPETALVPSDSYEPGSLEQLIGGEGIRSRWNAYREAQASELPADLSATEIFDFANAGNLSALEFVKHVALVLAQAIYNVFLVLNCPLFVLGGGVGQHPLLCAETNAVLTKWKLRTQPKIVNSSIGAEAQLLGSVYAALDVAKQNAVSPPHLQFVE